MTEKSFHDEIMRQGSMPISLLKLALGRRPELGAHQRGTDKGRACLHKSRHVGRGSLLLQ